MANYQSLKKEVITYLKARTPFIVIQSIERERVEQMLFEIYEEEQIEMEFYSDSKQVYKPDSITEGKNVNSNPLEYVTQTFKKKQYQTFVILDVNHISTDNIYSRELLNVLYLAKEKKGTVIVVTGDPVWVRLINLGLTTSLDLPNGSERTTQLIEFINKYKDLYPIDYNKEDLNLASTILKGFSKMQIENILSAELIIRGGLYKEHIYKLTEQKNRLYGTIPHVEYINILDEINVAGLDNLKSWLEKKKQIFFAPSKVLKEHDLSSPKGVLLVGVPGCGKSLSAKLIGSTWKLPLFKFNLDTIYDKYLGESERRMQEALRFIDNIAPCILWVDEIEKAISSDATNDTGKRIVSQFLFWLQEAKSRVFLVATANNIKTLPIELFRKGRFSEVFFIDLPNEEERREVIKLYLKKSLHKELDEKDLSELVELTNGYSYADIESAIKETAQELIIDPFVKIEIEQIKQSFMKIIPISKSSPQIIDNLRKWGHERATLASSRKRG